MSIPIEIGTDEQFAALRALLTKSNFTEEGLCKRYGLASLSDFEDIRDREQVVLWDQDVLGVLLRLFIETRFVPDSLLKERLGEETVSLLEDLGLVHGSEENLEESWAPVSIVPYAGVWSVCDSWHRPDRSVLAPKDPVYTPIVSNAHRFFQLMPKTKCDRLLELCSGTAFAALHAAKTFAKEAYAFDISPRSTYFAEFNRRLNDIPNATVKEGDLYEPADGLQFDRIVVHPPYVPVLRPKWVFHDGGSDGEAIVRRVIAEAPKYLAPGGMLYMLAMGTDRGQPYQHRVREWLGDQEADFDVAVFPIRLVPPDEFAVRATAGSQTHAEDTYRFKDLFRKLEIESLVYSVVLLQRKSIDRPTFTIRRQFGPRTGQLEMEWSMDWETLVVSPGAAESILNSRPKANPETELRVLHKLGEEGWETNEHMLVTPYPFSMEARTDPWAPYLMAVCDGQKTGRELFAELKEQNVLPQAAQDEEFARAVAILASGGYLFLENL